MPTPPSWRRRACRPVPVVLGTLRWPSTRRAPTLASTSARSTARRLRLTRLRSEGQPHARTLARAPTPLHASHDVHPISRPLGARSLPSNACVPGRGRTSRSRRTCRSSRRGPTSCATRSGRTWRTTRSRYAPARMRGVGLPPRVRARRPSPADDARGSRPTPRRQVSADSIHILKHHGSYMQQNRDLKKKSDRDSSYQFMLRLKVPVGEVPASLFRELDDLSNQYGQGDLRATTRQAFQLHGVVKKHLKHPQKKSLK